MLAASHAIFGAAIAVKVSNPAIGLPLAFISHFVVDMIPHWDFGQNRREKTVARLFLETAFDVLAGLFLVFLIFGGMVDPLYLLLAAFVAQSPDWLESPYFIFNLNVAPCRWIYEFQHKLHSKIKLPWGLVTQGVMAVVILLAFLW